MPLRLRPGIKVSATRDDTLRVHLPLGGAWEVEVTDAPRVAQALASPTIPPREIPNELHEMLEAQGLYDDDGTHDPYEAIIAGASTPVAAPRDGRIRIAGDGNLAALVREALATYGPDTAEAISLDDATASAGDHLIVALDHWDHAYLLRVNEARIEGGGPWLPLGPFEPGRILVGPFIVPEATACYRCHADRRLSNTSDPQGLMLRRAQAIDDARATAVPGAPQAAAALAALDILRWQRGHDPVTLGGAWSIGLAHLDTALDRVWRTPRCLSCSRHRRIPAPQPYQITEDMPSTPPS